LFTESANIAYLDGHNLATATQRAKWEQENEINTRLDNKSEDIYEELSDFEDKCYTQIDRRSKVMELMATV
jgi:prepilin-type processing-associated H-X9-DG protein